MKVKNIMFSGFAAALFATMCGAASAEDVQLISKQYADENLQGKLTPGDNIVISEDDKISASFNFGTEEAPITLEQALESKADASAVETLEGLVGETSVAEQITDKVGEINGTVADALDTKEDVSNKYTEAMTGDSLSAMSAEDKAKYYTSIRTAETIANAVVTNINAAAGDLGTLKTNVDNLVSTVGNTESGLVADVDALETGKQDKLTAENFVASGNALVTIAEDGKITISATDTTYETGTAETSGLTKLYTGTGENTDGTMTQAAITTALDGKLAADGIAEKATADAAGNIITDTYATQDVVNTKVTGIKTAGTYLVNFDATGNASYAPIKILGANGAEIDLTTGAVKE